MGALFHLRILSSEKNIFEGDIASLIAPGELGYLGILANHAPLVTSLVPGKITLKDADGKVTVLNNRNEGFLEINGNKATILICREVS